jgi:hypothetical protein
MATELSALKSAITACITVDIGLKTFILLQHKFSEPVILYFPSFQTRQTERDYEGAIRLEREKEGRKERKTERQKERRFNPLSFARGRMEVS